MASYKWSEGAVKWLINKTKATFLPKSDFREAKMGWGGQALADSISPVDAAMSAQHGANRFAFANAAGVTMEYSRDGGTTYADYNVGNYDSFSVFTGGVKDFYVGNRGKDGSIDDTLRITLNASTMKVYMRLRKLLICVSNQGAVGAKDATVTIECATIGAPSTYRAYGTYIVHGWSGWNSIPFEVTFGGAASQTSQVANIRLTFRQSGLYNGGPNLSVRNIFGFGESSWKWPSNMARTGHLYDYDMAQNAKFPAGVSAKTFNGYTIESNVPANAKFTDTTYLAATASSDGLMAKADKSKLDGFGAATEYAKKAEVAVKPIVYQNISVPASAWSSGASFAGATRTRYADIALAGVTSDMYATVTFNPDDIDNYNLAGICATKDGKITIYAEYAPSVAITIPTIICLKA